MSADNAGLQKKAKAILVASTKQSKTIATAESCTGGLVAAALTELPGSSRMFTHGFVTYANEAKVGMLGVPMKLITKHGAVSEEVACAMANGALKESGADIAVAVTGIAGPDGGSNTKPVGTVHFACACKGQKTIHFKKKFTGGRSKIRLAATNHALDIIHKELSKQSLGT